MIYLFFRKTSKINNKTEQIERNEISNAIEPVVGMVFVFTFYCCVCVRACVYVCNGLYVDIWIAPSIIETNKNKSANRKAKQ